jgi:hypothetical protein
VVELPERAAALMPVPAATRKINAPKIAPATPNRLARPDASTPTNRQPASASSARRAQTADRFEHAADRAGGRAAARRLGRIGKAHRRPPSQAVIEPRAASALIAAPSYRVCRRLLLALELATTFLAARDLPAERLTAVPADAHSRDSQIAWLITLRPAQIS